MLWDVQAWVGADYNKLWFKSEGSWLFDKNKFEEAETELLYSRNIATSWELQVGVRHDFKPDPDRTFGVLGFQGLAPYWFEVEATAYISEDGDLSAALETVNLVRQAVTAKIYSEEVAKYLSKITSVEPVHDLQFCAMSTWEMTLKASHNKIRKPFK